MFKLGWVMKLNETHYKHAGGTCPYCKNSEQLLFDEFHGETYCTQCGLVLHSSARNSIVEIIREAEEKEKRREKNFRKYLNKKYLNSLVVPTGKK
jgi:transcription initiation factor TFIIIB Brf1 subunit/transcription initiation factor TFIIB